jgi:DNA repair protein RadA/Sms
MSKQKTVFICNECRYQTIKWLGMCPGCESWASFEEKVQESLAAKPIKSSPKPILKFSQISFSEQARIKSGIDEWDRVMGGGVMPASLIILTGDPGIGKSTLLAQIAAKISGHKKVFYFSTEESLNQIKQRACRLGLEESNLFLSDERVFEAIEQTLATQTPDLAIIDSIQSCFLSESTSPAPGGIAQLKEIAFRLINLAKDNNVAIIATGHITKDGSMAGPKLLEHMVDAVFYLHGEQTFGNRILTATKNRFGPVGEVGFFQMNSEGLEPIQDINALLLQEAIQAPGSCLALICQGTRPVIVEFQALCVKSKFGQPQRIITGADYKRVSLMAAILEKYLKMSFSTHDLFFKVGGDISTKESNTDLAVALALISSYFGQPLCKNTLALGEISLTGQIKTNKKDLGFAQQVSKTGIQQLVIGNTDATIAATKTLIIASNVFQLLKLFPKKEREEL